MRKIIKWIYGPNFSLWVRPIPLCEKVNVRPCGMSRAGLVQMTTCLSCRQETLNLHVQAMIIPAKTFQTKGHPTACGKLASFLFCITVICIIQYNTKYFILKREVWWGMCELLGYRLVWVYSYISPTSITHAQNRGKLNLNSEIHVYNTFLNILIMAPGNICQGKLFVTGTIQENNDLIYKI